MKKLKFILYMLAMPVFVFAQQQANPKANASQQQPAQAQQQTQSQTPQQTQQGQTQQSAQAQGPQQASDTTQQSQAQDGAATAGEAAPLVDGGNESIPAGPSNVPAVQQTTTSQSGSPAVIADKNGLGRDGTNNKQRATMNMAGANAANIELSDNPPDNDVTEELRARQEKSQDHEASRALQRQRSGGPASTSVDDQQIDQRSREARNEASDQHLSSKNEAEGSKKNSGRKNRRGRN